MSIAPRTRVLIAGAGVAGMETALALRAFAGDRVEVELLDPAAELTLAAESTAHPFGRRPRAAPLGPLVRLAGAGLRHERLEEVLPEEGLALTDAGVALGYDRLVVAVGARATPFMDGAVTFGGAADVPALRRVVLRVVQGGRRGLRTRLAFVVPPGAVWPLPAYELAFRTDRLLRRRGVRAGVSLTLVTAEDAPLGVFGTVTSEAVADDLVRAGIALRAAAIVRDWSWGRLELSAGGHLAVDRLVALPLQRGPAIPGLPCDPQGFIRAGVDGRVAGRPDVFVVGDAGSFAVKHGGIACQQADAVARLIAHEVGAPVALIPFEPVLRGWLWDGDGGRFMRADLAGGRSEKAGVTSRRAPLWSPAEKVACGFLGAALRGEPLSDAPMARTFAAEAPSR